MIIYKKNSNSLINYILDRSINQIKFSLQVNEQLLKRNLILLDCHHFIIYRFIGLFHHIMKTLKEKSP